MTQAAEIIKSAPRGVDIVDRPEELATIHRADCAATIWRRQPVAGFQSWIDRLAPEQLPKARLILRPTDVRQAASEICAASGTPKGPERARLVDDVAALADIFAGLMQAEYVRLRFDVVTTNACRKFHVDAVKARLVCTYRGTGTQYGISAGGTEPRRIFTVPTGAPVVLRGTHWPERPRAGLLHRSPPIQGTGETRMLVVLDPVNDPDVPL